MSTDDWATTPRGFVMQELPYSDYEGTVPRTIQVQQSSIATEDRLWLGPDSVSIKETPSHSGFVAPRMHLGVEEVRWLRDRLNEWLGDKPDPVQDMIDEGQR